MPLPPLFAEQLQRLGMSVSTLATQMGVTRAHAYRLLQGQTPNPGVQTLHRLALALALPPSVVYGVFVGDEASLAATAVGSAHPHEAEPARAPQAMTPAPTLVARIDVLRNELVLQGHGVVALHSRWAGAVLAMLWQLSRGGDVLTLEALQQWAIQTNSHASALGRTQVLRLMGGLSDALAYSPYWPWRLAHAPRHASTGPWWLELKDGARPCVVDVLGVAGDGASVATLGLSRDAVPTSLHEHADHDKAKFSDAIPRLLTGQKTDVLALCAVVRGVVTSDAFAQEGDLENALLTLPKSFEFPISSECQALLALRRIHLNRRMGNLAAAHATLEPWLDGTNQAGVDATQTDPFWPDRWFIALQRLHYDGQPGVYWPRLLQNADRHQPQLGPDARMSAEWHNLQALALRRAMLVDRSISTDHGLPAAHDAHDRAMRHYETVLYHALCLTEPDRLHAYIANVAYHMQKAFSALQLKPDAVLQWCELSTTLDDKLDSGHDDVWDWLFFAEFWLDHRAELSSDFLDALEHLQPTSGSRSQHHPSHAAFYDALLKRAQRLQNPRQWVEAHVLQWRWAKLQHNENLQEVLKKQLQALLQAHPDVHQLLLDEGQGHHLPD